VRSEFRSSFIKRRAEPQILGMLFKNRWRKCLQTDISYWLVASTPVLKKKILSSHWKDHHPVSVVRVVGEPPRIKTIIEGEISSNQGQQ